MGRLGADWWVPEVSGMVDGDSDGREVSPENGIAEVGWCSSSDVEKEWWMVIV